MSRHVDMFLRMPSSAAPLLPGAEAQRHQAVPRGAQEPHLQERIGSRISIAKNKASLRTRNHPKSFPTAPVAQPPPGKRCIATPSQAALAKQPVRIHMTKGPTRQLPNHFPIKPLPSGPPTCRCHSPHSVGSPGVQRLREQHAESHRVAPSPSRSGKVPSAKSAPASATRSSRSSLHVLGARQLLMAHAWHVPASKGGPPLCRSSQTDVQATRLCAF